VVTYRLWNRRFGRDPSIIGRTIELDGLPYTVIGAMPRRFQEWGADIYLPLDFDLASTNRSQRNLTVAGVIKRGLSAEQTEPALRDLARQVETQYGVTNHEYEGLVYVPYDVREGVLGDLRASLYVLLSAVALLLLITAANTASLQLARTRARSREIGTRLALGSTQARLARQFLTESVLLSAVQACSGCCWECRR
jgi:ABC-type antimicrobial peptide transport system permease subunit